MGSCLKNSSIRRGLDLTGLSPNGPKQTQEWLKAVSPKNAKNGKTGRGLRPRTLREGGMARPSPLPKRSPCEMVEEEEEEARSTGGSSTPNGRRRRSDLHMAPRHAPTPPEAR